MLNALQNSPLSGSYTAYNYYLQSAIDAGTLGGVESQVGGQVYADAASYLLRQPLWLDWAIAPYAQGADLEVGQRRFWLVGLGGYFASNGRAGIADSTSDNGGSLVGVTYRLGERVAADMGIGYTAGSIGCAGAYAEVHAVPVTLGGRVGWFALDDGPFLAARADLGWADYATTRALGGGLGVAHGATNGALYSGRFDVGDVLHLPSGTLTPLAGFRLTQATLGSVNENGTQMALNVEGLTQTIPSCLADLEFALNPRTWNGWIVTPSADVGYELALGNPQVATVGSLYGYRVSQVSAYDTWYLAKLGLAVTAQRGAATVTAGVDGLFGDGTATGIIPQVSLGYSF